MTIEYRASDYKLSDSTIAEVLADLFAPELCGAAEEARAALAEARGIGGNLVPCPIDQDAKIRREIEALQAELAAKMALLSA